MIKAGIIGLGYWGPNLLRNFSAINNCEVTYVADLRIERLNQISKHYPSTKFITDTDEVIASSHTDAIIIATPVYLHYQLAKKALLAGKHVMVEKPLASSVAECEELIDIAKRNNLLLMVDHTFLYTGAVKKLKQLINKNDLGAIKYYDSTRINLGLFQPDINVLWDLAPHDIAILKYLISEEPVSVNATGISHTGNGIENIAYMTLHYQSGLIAHFNCSWTSPVKIRQVLIGGDKRMVLYNDMEPSEKLKVYDTGYNMNTDDDNKKSIMIDYRTGDVFIPKLETTESLQGVANDFINCIMNKTQPVSNYEIGLSVIKILEASSLSIKQHGKKIKI